MTGLCGQRLIGQGRAHAVSSARSISVLAQVGEAVSLAVCATDEMTQPPSCLQGLSGCFSFSCGSGGQTLRGQGSGPSERFCLFLAGSGLTSGWLEPNATGVSGLRRGPLLGIGNMACTPGAPRAGSGMVIPEASIHPGQCSPAQYWLSGSRATGWIILCSNQLETVNHPICWGQGKPTGCVERASRDVISRGST